MDSKPVFHGRSKFSEKKMALKKVAKEKTTKPAASMPKLAGPSKNQLMAKTKVELTALAKKIKLALPSKLLKEKMATAIFAGLKKTKKTILKKTSTKTKKSVTSQKVKRDSSLKRPPLSPLLRKEGKSGGLPQSFEKLQKASPGKAPDKRAVAKSSPKTSLEKSTPPVKIAVPKKHAKEKEMPVSSPPSQSAPVKGSRITALLKDPHWIYCHWDLEPEAVEEARQESGGLEMDTNVLRVWDHTDPKDITSFDIHTEAEAKSWYVRLDANRKYLVEIGFQDPDGEFHSLAGSDLVKTPRFGIAPQLRKETVGEEWFCREREFVEVFALSNGLHFHANPKTVVEMMHKRELISSPGTFPSSPGFWPHGSPKN